MRPRWIGYVLPGAALLTIVGTLIAPSGPAANLSLNLFSNLGPMLLMGVFVCLGYALWSEERLDKQSVPGLHTQGTTGL